MRTISTENAPAAIGPYSQGKVIELGGGRGLLFASGQVPLDPQTGAIVGADVQEQAERALSNVMALLAAAGTDAAHVVKTTCFLSDIADFAAFNEVYARYFGEGLPARSAVGVAGLPKGALCEVEVIALIEA